MRQHRRIHLGHGLGFIARHACDPPNQPPRAASLSRSDGGCAANTIIDFAAPLIDKRVWSTYIAAAVLPTPMRSPEFKKM
jgi:hypothetical protein